MSKKQATVSSRTIRQYSGRTHGLDASLAGSVHTVRIWRR